MMLALIGLVAFAAVGYLAYCLAADMESGEGDRANRIVLGRIEEGLGQPAGAISADLSDEVREADLIEQLISGTIDSATYRRGTADLAHANDSSIRRAQ